MSVDYTSRSLCRCDIRRCAQSLQCTHRGYMGCDSPGREPWISNMMRGAGPPMPSKKLLCNSHAWTLTRTCSGGLGRIAFHRLQHDLVGRQRLSDSELSSGRNTMTAHDCWLLQPSRPAAAIWKTSRGASQMTCTIAYNCTLCCSAAEGWHLEIVPVDARER